MKTLSTSSIIVLTALAACGTSGGAKLGEYEARDKLTAHQLEVFDDLDYNVFSNQKWTEILEEWHIGHSPGSTECSSDVRHLFIPAPIAP